MIKKAKQKILLGCAILFLVIPFGISNSSSNKIPNNGIEKFKTLEDLLGKRKRYFTPNSSLAPDRIFRILVVPGHDDEYSGAVFNQTKEVELNRKVANKLVEFLSKEPGIEVVSAHQENKYNPFLDFAFVHYKEKIEYFMEQSISGFLYKKEKEEIDLGDSDFHNAAVPDVRYRLYGINWWATQNQIDLVIHIHFNDYRDRKKGEHKYDGFSMYIPGEHFGNHELSKIVGESIFKQLKKIRPISNLPYEEEGIIEGHELIAVGSHESLSSGSVLVEYGYIYEDIFHDPLKQDVTFDYLAYATYIGIKDALGENYFSKENLSPKITPNKTTRDNLIWQFEKALKGIYPPQGKDLRDCPITGYFGECSRMVK